MDYTYLYRRSLVIDDNFIEKFEFTLKKMYLWRELKLPVTTSTHLLEDYILKVIIFG